MSTPIDTVNQLLDALNRGDLEAALDLYEPHAVLVAGNGQFARGTTELHNALEQLIHLKPKLRSEVEKVVQVDDVALYTGRWTGQGSDPSGRAVSMGGDSSDVLRRHQDGRWLIAVDNPWGAQILESAR